MVYDYQGSSVITGIQAGDKVVVEGKQNLRPGGKTREAKSSDKAEPKAESPPSPAPTAPAQPAASATPPATPSTTDKK